MPIYEYECLGCGSRFDRRIAMRDPDPACASCGATRVRRLISMFAASAGVVRDAQPAAMPAGGGCCGGACGCG